MRIILALMLVLGNYAFSKELYRWVDQSGHVNYTSTPPESQKAPQIDSANVIKAEGDNIDKTVKTGGKKSSESAKNNGTKANIPPTEQIGTQKGNSLQAVETPSAGTNSNITTTVKDPSPEDMTRSKADSDAADLNAKKQTNYTAYIPTKAMLIEKDLLKNASLKKLPDVKDMNTEKNNADKPALSEEAVKANAQACADAKENLKQLDSGLILQIEDEAGVKHTLSEEEKAAQKEYTQKAIAFYCTQ